jgi:peptide/nickel transport system permease protein
VPWTFGRVLDMLKHIWVPMLILGTAGTAGLTRIVRANMLDELNKPYVQTARAKGLTERRLLLKYPTRIALNPFVSTVGWALPRLFSGSTIVANVLGLPTIGPLLLRALMAQDMFLAGSIILILTSLTMVGTLVSDILLAAIDPRIRMGG